jgi:hypothetical protein
MIELTTDESLSAELATIQAERQDADRAEAKRRLQDRSAAEQARLDAQADEQEKQQKHRAAVRKLFDHVTVMGHTASAVETYHVAWIQELIRLNSQLVDMLPLAAEASEDGSWYEREIMTQLITNVRHEMASHGIPPALRAFFPARVDGGPVKPLCDLTNAWIENLLTQITEDLNR